MPRLWFNGGYSRARAFQQLSLLSSWPQRCPGCGLLIQKALSRHVRDDTAGAANEAAFCCAPAACRPLSEGGSYGRRAPPDLLRTGRSLSRVRPQPPSTKCAPSHVRSVRTSFRVLMLERSADVPRQFVKPNCPSPRILATRTSSHRRANSTRTERRCAFPSATRCGRVVCFPPCPRQA